nr:zinc protease PQQL-like isoform X5 [Ipomoea batatas]
MKNIGLIHVGSRSGEATRKQAGGAVIVRVKKPWRRCNLQMLIMVVVNLGQRAFKYAPAKSGTPNPCFIGPLASNSPATIGYEENKELFSMGKIEN